MDMRMCILKGVSPGGDSPPLIPGKALSYGPTHLGALLGPCRALSYGPTQVSYWAISYGAIALGNFLSP